MTVSSIIVLTLSLLCLYSLTTPRSVAAAPADGVEVLSAYQVLQTYGYPKGLLPEGVTGYELNRCTGQFKVYLKGPCNFTTAFYPLRFEPTISGIIGKDRITDIRGVSVKSMWWWWSDIDEVRRIGEELRIASGLFGFDMQLDRFQICPHCGCGFDCDHNAPAQPVHQHYSDKIIEIYGEENLEVVEKLEEVGKEMSTRISEMSSDGINAERSDSIKCFPPSEKVLEGEISGPSQEVSSQCDQEDNFCKLSAQIRELTERVEKLTEDRLNLTALYRDIMKMRDFDELSLLSAFDFLVKNENMGKAFLLKSAKHRRLWLEGFCRKNVNE